MEINQGNYVMIKYSEEQIKKAFWATFHKAGDLWFNYLGDDESNEKSTKYQWDEFLEELQNEQSDKNNDSKKGLA